MQPELKKTPKVAVSVILKKQNTILVGKRKVSK